MESHNLIDLTAELHLLALGQYFAESFAKWAAINSVDVPSTSILWATDPAYHWFYIQVSIGILLMLFLAPSHLGYCLHQWKGRLTLEALSSRHSLLRLSLKLVDSTMSRNSVEVTWQGIMWIQLGVQLMFMHTTSWQIVMKACWWLTCKVWHDYAWSHLIDSFNTNRGHWPW